MKNRVGILLLALAIFAAVPALATSTIYMDQSAFLSALQSPVNPITFDDLDPVAGTWLEYSTAAGLTVGGVQFIGYNVTAFDEFLFHPTATDHVYNYNSNTVLTDANYWPGTKNYFQVVLPANITAVGLDVMTTGLGKAGGDLHNVQIGLANGEKFSVTTADNPIRTFWGVTTDSAIASITLEAPDSRVIIDNVYAGSAKPKTDPGPGPVPEMTSLFLIGTGISLLGLLPKFVRS